MNFRFLSLLFLITWLPLGGALQADEWGGSAADIFLLDEDDDANANITLQFGSALAEYFQWDTVNTRFNLSDTLRVSGNLEQDGTVLTLDADNSGAGANLDIVANQGADSAGTLRYDATDNQWKISNDGSSFEALAAGAGAASIPYINGQTFKKIAAVSTPVTLTIYGGGFTPSTTVSIPSFDGTVGTPNVISPEEIEVVVTPGATEALYDIVLANGSSLNTDWAGNGVGLLDVKNLTIVIPGSGGVTWNNTSTDVSATNGTLVPTVTTSGWNKGASFGTAPAATDFTLSFGLQYMTGQSSGGYAMFGVDNSDPNTNYNTIDYAIYLQNGANVYIYENGSSRGLHSTFTATDTFSIERNGTTITYLKNGSVFYTSLVASSAAMVFDSSIYRYLGANNLSLSY